MGFSMRKPNNKNLKVKQQDLENKIKKLEIENQIYESELKVKNQLSKN